MKENGMISIIIPVYNACKYIEYTIQSILQQTYTNYEAIFIDDGSTDKSIEIIERYQEKSSKIKLIKLSRNRGPAIARNIGIRSAKGRYLTFLDADDLWINEKLEKQMKFIKDNDKAFVYGEYQYINEKGTKHSKTIKVQEQIDYKQSLKDNRIITSTVMIDLNQIPKRHCYMLNVMNEDVATWWKILKKGHVAEAEREILAYYRKTPNSRSSNKMISAYYRWKLYRNIEHLGVSKSIYYFLHYILYAAIKRIGKLEKIANFKKEIQIIVSAQNIRNDDEARKMIEEMNISSKYLIINQTDYYDDIKEKNIITKHEKGLSKSRNCGIKESNSDIILFADNDIKYHEGYEKIIENAYEKYTDADIICFYVKSKNKNRKIKRINTGRIFYIKAMKVTSFEISCKKDSIINNQLLFDENYGAGSKYNRGEEQIFLYEALRKKLKIYFVNKEIATVEQDESSWFCGYDENFFEVQGHVFKKLSNKFYVLLILQYAIRKYFLYYKKISLLKATNAMFRGTKILE